MCERTTAEYEEELSPTKEEKERQHQLLDAVFKKVVSHRTDLQQPLHIKEDDPLPPHVKEKEEDPQPPRIKEEEEELWITQEEECLLGQEEADLTKFPLTVVSVKTEDHEEKPPECSQLHHSQTVVRNITLGSGTGPPGRGRRIHSPPTVTKEHGEPQEDKEEFPLTVLIVKNEDKESESEEKREAEPPSRSSTQHMTTEADEDHCGGSPADKLLAPLSDSDETTSHSPDTDDEDLNADKARMKCYYCDKTFSHRRNLKKHTRIHTGYKPYSCSICGKDFTQRQHLKTHKRTHTGEKPFMCSVCCKRFSLKENLKTHTRIHTGEKRFSCPFCGKAFIQNSDLKIHTRIHTGEKPYSCPSCDKGFADRSTLVRHMRTHTEKALSCSVCSKRFSRRENLTVHARRHTGEKPYPCPSCDKSFAGRSTLNKHTRTHTGEKVLSCSVCDERFSYKYQCQKHKCAGQTNSSK
ncbi:zinc finger protein 771-like [Nerophis ophidion]|uniref:zinc finger protein 771-like n=1 Tax=Nerophis ophidion TaxID=159077 RepID=UPI002AE0A59B|nr:zinc finger protein 771-like [Nerophis ophidion]